jgi:hypothetical protein
MDDLMQNIFYQPQLKKTMHENFCLSFIILKFYVKGGT